MSKDFPVVFCVVLGLSILGVAGVALADGDLGRSITDILSFDSLDISQGYSRTGEVIDSINHSFQVTASGDGRSRIVNVLSVSPVEGDRFRSGSYINYNSSGGELSAKEKAGAIICDYQHICEQDGLAVDMAAGYEITGLTQGVVRSNMRIDPAIAPVASYNLSASSTGGGEVKTEVAMTSFSDDSQQNYAQQITVKGNFYLDYLAEMN
jgi:hypothetical protein